MPESSAQTLAPIRIVLADDHAIFRNGVIAMLKTQTGLEIIGEASNGKELVEIVRESKPDVVLTDIQMPVMDGIEATKAIKSNHPAIGVVALSMFDQERMISAMMQAGAKGYLLKNTTKEEMVQAVHIVHAQGTYYCSTATNRMVHLMTKGGCQTYQHHKQLQFSERDIKIIQLLCQEKSNKEIADVLKTSCRTLEGARERIQQKINARNVVGVVLYALCHGIFNID